MKKSPFDVSPRDAKLGNPSPGMTSGYSNGDGAACMLLAEASTQRMMVKVEAPLKIMIAVMRGTTSTPIAATVSFYVLNPSNARHM